MLCVYCLGGPDISEARRESSKRKGWKALSSSVCFFCFLGRGGGRGGGGDTKLYVEEEILLHTAASRAQRCSLEESALEQKLGPRVPEQALSRPLFLFFGF